MGHPSRVRGRGPPRSSGPLSSRSTRPSQIRPSPGRGRPREDWAATLELAEATLLAEVERSLGAIKADIAKRLTAKRESFLAALDKLEAEHAALTVIESESGWAHRFPDGKFTPGPTAHVMDLRSEVSDEPAPVAEVLAALRERGLPPEPKVKPFLAAPRRVASGGEAAPLIETLR